METETLYSFEKNSSFLLISLSLVMDWALEEFSIIVFEFDKLRQVTPF